MRDRLPEVKKSKRISLAVTPAERQAIAKVAEANGIKDHSLILRQKSLTAVMREYRKLQALFGKAA